MNISKLYLSFLLIFFTSYLNAQITFQKLFRQTDSASSLQTFDAKQTFDGGYVMSGIASEGANNNLYHPYIIKTNCHGVVQWKHFFGTTQSTGNTYGKVIQTLDSGYVMINNLGVYNNYNGFIVKLDKMGNILWQKLLNLSNGNDNVNDIIELANGNLALTGSIKNPPDVGLIMLDNTGSLLWCKTYGNNNQYDDGSVLIKTNDGGFMISGRYISMGTFNAFLLKTDSIGNLQWLKCYGDTLQHMWGFDIKELNNGDFVMVGSTTLLKPNFQSYGDNFIMRLNNIGDTLWTKIFYGTPDLFENASSVIVDEEGNFIVCVATASYNTPGIVPNKHAIMKFSSTGTLIMAKIYNDGSSHYPRLTTTHDNGYLLNGFSTKYTGPVGFQTLLIKLNQNLESGCNEIDVTAQTVVTSKVFKITSPIPILGNSGNVVNNTSTFQSFITDTTLCEYYPLLSATIDTEGHCINQPINLKADTVGITYWHWDFGDPNTLNDTAYTPTAQYIYSALGTYTITLTVSNGCDTVINTQVIKIDDCVALQNDNIQDLKYMFNYYNHQLTFINKSQDMFQAKLYDMQGRSVQHLSFAPGITIASLSYFAKGMYILSVLDNNNKRILSEKITIE